MVPDPSKDMPPLLLTSAAAAAAGAAMHNPYYTTPFFAQTMMLVTAKAPDRPGVAWDMAADVDVLIDKGVVLGRGTFGVVYRGLLRGNKAVAVKVAARGSNGMVDYDSIKALMHEAQVRASTGGDFCR